jgi:hypothetical protein
VWRRRSLFEQFVDAIDRKRLVGGKQKTFDHRLKPIARQWPRDFLAFAA